MKTAWLLAPLVFVACKKTEPTSEAPTPPTPAVSSVVPNKPVAPSAPLAPTEEQALAVASAWLADVSEVDLKGMEPSRTRLSDQVSVEDALEGPHEDCPKVVTTLPRDAAITCAVAEIGWVSGVLSRNVIATTASTTREVIAHLEPEDIRALERPLRVEMTVALDATNHPVIRRVRFSNPKDGNSPRAPNEALALEIARKWLAAIGASDATSATALTSSFSGLEVHGSVQRPRGCPTKLATVKNAEAVRCALGMMRDIASDLAAQAGVASGEDDVAPLGAHSPRYVLAALNDNIRIEIAVAFDPVSTAPSVAGVRLLRRTEDEI